MDLRVINFPDKVFKKYLIDTFDKDGDGEISLTEALTITQVLCSQKGIKSVAETNRVGVLGDSLKLTSCLVSLSGIFRSSDNLFKSCALFSVASDELSTLHLASLH